MVTKLYSKDKKGKIRVIEMSLLFVDDVYIIKTTTGQLGGKMTERPDDVIAKGKVKRTIKEQAELQYNSKLNKYKDKGNKTLDDLGYASGDINDFLQKHLPDVKTDQNGLKKCMKALSYKEVTEEFINSKTWLESAKLDGCRCQLLIKDGVIEASSRGGKSYNPAIPHIINDPETIKFFSNHPDVILDGELYIHGKTLQEISGIARTKKNIELKPKLEFHVYEIMNDETAFNRYMTLCKLSKEFELCNYIKLHKQVSIGSLKEALALHDEYVSNGYEGAVIKDVNSLYAEGYNNTMLKIKLMEDAEFEIIGIVEKKRAVDFVFKLKTVEGKEFEAKPKGEESERLNLKEQVGKLIGKMATVQYFGFTPGGVPNLPVFKCVRDYE